MTPSTEHFKNIHTFESQLRQLYPGTLLEDKKLLMQPDRTSCGAYAIENLLLLLQKLPAPNTSAEILRTIHLEALRVHNPVFFTTFNIRQRDNRPTIAPLSAQLRYLQQGPPPSKTDLAKIIEIKQCFQQFSPYKYMQGEIMKIFALSLHDGDEHRDCLNVIRTRLKVLAKRLNMPIHKKPFDSLLKLLFNPKMDIRQFLTEESPDFRIAFEHIQAAARIEALPKEVEEVKKRLELQIKEDVEFARQLQEELRRDTLLDTKKEHQGKRKMPILTCSQ
jgi:hypothetical protein